MKLVLEFPPFLDGQHYGDVMPSGLSIIFWALVRLCVEVSETFF